jgi:carbon storage regulator
MLILSRKDGQSVVIGESITVTVLSAVPGRVSLAFEAPANIRVLRAELLEPQEPSDEPLLPQDGVHGQRASRA